MFDTVAALLGFTRAITFEAQAAMWLEHLARSSELDGDVSNSRWSAAGSTFAQCSQLSSADRLRGRDVAEIARAFHQALADAIVAAADSLEPKRIVASGGVFQNALLIELLAERLGDRLWINQKVPANDGGISLGQAGIAALSVSS